MQGMPRLGQNLEPKGLTAKIFWSKELAAAMEPFGRPVVMKLLVELPRISGVCVI
jgi:hypothetical protein